MKKTLAILIFSTVLLMSSQTWAQDDTTKMPADTAAAESMVEPDSGMAPPAETMPDEAKTMADTMQSEQSEMGTETDKASGADDSQPAASEEVMEDAQPEEMQEAEPVDPSAPYSNVKFAPGEKPRIRMETNMGTIVIELWPDVAPKHCQSFYHLTEKGFYDSLTFHRIVPGFVIQGGCPYGNGTGGPGYNVPAEFNDIPHEDGILSMARASDPNSAGSQFFICLGRLSSLDNKYTVFGKVVEGLDIVHKIEGVPVSDERPRSPVVMTNVEVVKPEAPAAETQGDGEGEEE